MKVIPSLFSQEVTYLSDRNQISGSKYVIENPCIFALPCGLIDLSHTTVTLTPLLSKRGNGSKKQQAGSASFSSVSYNFKSGPCGQNRAAKTNDISAYAKLQQLLSSNAMLDEVCENRRPT